MSLESLLSGQVVNGKYLLCESLGGGGNGDVFRAEKVLKMLMGRPVSIEQETDYAVKIIARNDDAPDRLLSELRLATTLKHPHILHGYEAGTTTLYKKGFLFLAMEKAEESLHARLALEKQTNYAQRPLSPQEAQELARCLLTALDHTHNLPAPVVHFDLKPSNILWVKEKGRRGTWKLADFGIARVLQGTSAHLTLTSAGSQSYKPPERFGLMDFSVVSPAHDLWQLGITLLEALGKIPIGGGEQIAVHALMKQNYAPSEDISSPLRDVIAGCLLSEWRERITACDALSLLSPTPQTKPVESPHVRRVEVAEPSPIRPVAPQPKEKIKVVAKHPISTEKTNPKDGAELALIPASEFLMGDDTGDENEIPQHKVYLDAYFIYKTPVSVAMYRQFCLETKHNFAAISQPPWGWKDDHPMVSLSWEDARVYCKWAGGFLPTEAQWEKAARGTDGRRFPWGQNWDENNCNNYITGPKRTTPSGFYPQGASSYGVLDMAGNVWEWCYDWYDANYYAQHSPSERNPTGPSQATSRRVLRGCSWINTSPDGFRCAYRFMLPPNSKLFDTSFRCVICSK